MNTLFVSIRLCIKTSYSSNVNSNSQFLNKEQISKKILTMFMFISRQLIIARRWEFYRCRLIEDHLVGLLSQFIYLDASLLANLSFFLAHLLIFFVYLEKSMLMMADLLQSELILLKYLKIGGLGEWKSVINFQFFALFNWCTMAIEFFPILVN